MLVQRIKELETENEQLRKVPAPAQVKEVPVKEKEYIVIRHRSVFEKEEENKCEKPCAHWTGSGCPYPPYEDPSECGFFEAKPKA